MSNSDVITLAFNQFARSAGFRPAGGGWLRDVPVGVQVIELQKSEWGDQFHVNFGVYARELGSVRSPKVHQCQFYARADSVDPTNEANWKSTLDLEKPIDDAARQSRVAELLGRMLAFLDSITTKQGLREAADRGDLSRGLFLLTLKQYLGLR